MIAVSRRKNDSIVINDDISVVILDIHGDKVVVGIEAPPEVSVHRHEMYGAIRRSRQASDVESFDNSVGEFTRDSSSEFAAKVAAWRTTSLRFYNNALSAARRWWNDLSERAAPPFKEPERPLIVTEEKTASDVDHDRLGDALEAESTPIPEAEKRPTKKVAVKKTSRATAAKKSVENTVAKKRTLSKPTAKKVAKTSQRKSSAAATEELADGSTAKSVKKRSTKGTTKKEATPRRRTPK